LEVITVLKNGLDNSLTPEQVAKDIEAIQPRVFSKARARTIATTEIGKAYEYGNYMPVQQLNSVGVNVKKYWLTCNDARVRPEHMACEEEGRKPLDYVYPSVGVEICPEGVNCRCSMEYDFDL
jgi:SPP1 gp7 family putative phage head morphogenesis protein